LIHVATGQLEAGRYRRGVARGWIAIGDVAIGGLLAVGGAAVATHANDAATREFWQETLPRLTSEALQYARWAGIAMLLALFLVRRSATEAPPSSRRTDL
jgi:hypothetical protein